MGTGKTTIVEALQTLGYKVFEPDMPRESMPPGVKERLKKLRREENWDEHNKIFWKTQALWLEAKDEDWDVFFGHGPMNEKKLKFIPLEYERGFTFMLSDPIQHILGVMRRTEAGATEESDQERVDLYNAVKLCASNSISNLDEAEFFHNQALMVQRIVELLKKTSERSSRP